MAEIQENRSLPWDLKIYRHQLSRKGWGEHSGRGNRACTVLAAKRAQKLEDPLDRAQSKKQGWGWGCEGWMGLGEETGGADRSRSNPGHGGHVTEFAFQDMERSL